MGTRAFVGFDMFFGCQPVLNSNHPLGIGVPKVGIMRWSIVNLGSSSAIWSVAIHKQSRKQHRHNQLPFTKQSRKQHCHDHLPFTSHYEAVLPWLAAIHKSQWNSTAMFSRHSQSSHAIPTDTVAIPTIVSSMGYVVLSGKIHVLRQDTTFLTFSS